MTQTAVDKTPPESTRYELLDDLGGGQTATYLAHDRESGEEVIVKMLDVRRTDEWKAVELFEREIELLGALEHPAIPKILDAFVEEDQIGQRARLVMVQEYIRGADLVRAVYEGYRVDETRARAIARELLDILSYLHAQDPPVIHRDVKPANIIRGEDDRLHLVDFGAVGRFISAKGGSTVIGTAGYVPTEQLAGRAVPASDLYALGATLVFLLSRRPPSELPVERMRLAFRKVTNVSEEFAEFLDRLLAPAPEDRPKDAAQALAELDNLGSKLPVRWSGSIANQSRRLRPPKGTNIAVERTPERLRVHIPSALGHYGAFLSGAPVWLGFQFAVGQGLHWAAVVAIYVVIALAPYILLRLVSLQLVLTPNQFEATYRFLGKPVRKIAPTSRFERLGYGLFSAGDRAGYSVYIETASQEPQPLFLGISKAEKRWIVELFEPEETE